MGILAWSIVVAVVGFVVFAMIHNVVTDGWFFVGAMAAVLAMEAAFLWAVAFLVRTPSPPLKGEAE